MRYKTLKDLKQAYDSGEVRQPMIIDNDHVSVWEDEKEGDTRVFGGLDYSPHDLLTEALNLLGIPWEDC